MSLGSSPNITRAEANRFVASLNSRQLCACATLRQLVQLGVPGPYLPCEVHRDTRQRYGWIPHLMSDFAHAAWNDCAYGCTDVRTCTHYTYKLDGVAYVHKSLSARYAQTPLCGFTGDGDSLHGDDAYVTCPDCIAAR